MKTDKIYYGAAYYDEYMPYDRIETDMEMMNRAGMNLIRIAESTWSTWEPREGEFDFTHLHRMLDAAQRHHISVIVGTPTYAIPTWLAAKDPSILALTHNGQEIYGRRQNMDIMNPTYRSYAGRMICRLVAEVSSYDCVIGYQIDNETKAYDTCTHYAQEEFVKRLKARFPDLDAFNHEFGLDYWSNRVNDWEYFPDIRGTINMSLAAEYEKYLRDIVTEFFEWQAGLIGKYKRSDQFITHNFDYAWIGYSLGLHPDINQFDASRFLDVAGCDIYHLSEDDLTGKEITIGGNITRGLKHGENFLVLETGAQGNTGWLPYPGQLRLQAYSHFANGANCVEYWHWHSIHNAIETYWKGVLSHDLAENETYRECAVIGNELQRIGDHIKNLQKKNKLALLLSNEALTGMKLFPTQTNGEHSYNLVARWFADALFAMNIEYDVIGVENPHFVDYDIVIAPALYSAPEALLQELDAYVKGGGSLITTFKSGFSNEHLKVYTDTQPHILSRALGIRYDQFTFPKDVSVTFGGVTSEAKEWMELVSPLEEDGAEVLASYGHHTWNRYAAITHHRYGKGQAMYLATLFGEDTLIEVLKDFLARTGFAEPDKVRTEAQHPIVVKQGVNDFGKRVVYYLNYSRETQRFRHTGGSGRSLFDGAEILDGGEISLAPWDLQILEMD